MLIAQGDKLLVEHLGMHMHAHLAIYSSNIPRLKGRMFDGSEQFIASSRASLPIFPLNGNPSFSFSAAYAPPKKFPLISTDLALESDRSANPWSNDELLALLKVRSTFDLWFPDFTWEHVSRKLGELGFKRSGEECKEKLEEESRQFNNSRILSELDEFYPGAQEEPAAQIPAPPPNPQGEKGEDDVKNLEGDQGLTITATENKSKRKRRDKFETFRGLCEGVVGRMMAKQEELHRRLVEDMVRRDEEKAAREEAWRRQETERMREETEARAREQKAAAERQATIIHFLTHFASENEKPRNNNNNNNHNNATTTTTSNSNSNSNSSASVFCKTEAGAGAGAAVRRHSQPPSSPSSTAASDVGKRWPRDEVLALINLRCKTSGGGSAEEGAKGPLWERISQGMMEMGYKRSAKRCKEKWENINKYFRKTKDSSKKRSVNSRTCPYFHQLSCLYSDGTIVAPSGGGGGAATAEINE